MSECKMFTKEELHAPNLKEFTYEFPSIGYCVIGKDYVCEKCVVTVTVKDLVPDVDDILRQQQEWSSTCLQESSEGRGQRILNYFWELCKPLKVTVVLGPGRFGHGVKLEKTND